MANKTTRVYTLFPTWLGRLSVKTEDYNKTIIKVAAVSVKQAFYLAGNDIWIDPDATTPRGILSIWINDRHCLQENWCCFTSHADAPNFKHMAGVRAIRETITQHTCKGVAK